MKETLQALEIEDQVQAPEIADINLDSPAEVLDTPDSVTDDENSKGDKEEDKKEEKSKIPGLTAAEVKARAAELEALGPILNEHGGTIIICDRLGGAQMTLSEAVIAIWPPSSTGAMILEGFDSVMAEIQKMLANQPKEQTDDKKAEDKVEAELAAKDEKEAEATKAEAEAAKASVPEQDVAEEPSTAQVAETEAEQVGGSIVQTTSNEIANDSLVVEAEIAAGTTRAEAAKAAVQTEAQKSGLASEAAAELLKTESLSEPEIDVQPESSQVKANVEPEQMVEELQLPDTEVLLDPSGLAEIVEPAPEITEIDLSDAEFVEMDETEVNLESPALEIGTEREEFEPTFQKSQLIDLVEEQLIQIDHFEESALDLGLADALDAELELEQEALVSGELITEYVELGEELDWQGAKALEIESPLEISQPAEEIEASLSLLAEAIATAEDEESATANDLLDQIMEVPTKFYEQDSELSEAEAEAE